jgi:hypothetical protein
MNDFPFAHGAPDDASATSPFSRDLPCAGGLICGTLALMTSWASPTDTNGPALHPLLSRKIVSNLFFLRHHPDLSEPMRKVIGKMHGRWVEIAQGAQPAAHSEFAAAPLEQVLPPAPHLH